MPLNRLHCSLLKKLRQFIKIFLVENNRRTIVVTIAQYLYKPSVSWLNKEISHITYLI